MSISKEGEVIPVPLEPELLAFFWARTPEELPKIKQVIDTLLAQHVTVFEDKLKISRQECERLRNQGGKLEVLLRLLLNKVHGVTVPFRTEKVVPPGAVEQLAIRQISVEEGLREIGVS